MVSSAAVDHHAGLHAGFRWYVPEVFNIAEVCSARWARDTPAAVAIRYEHEDGRAAPLCKPAATGCSRRHRPTAADRPPDRPVPHAASSQLLPTPPTATKRAARAPPAASRRPAPTATLRRLTSTAADRHACGDTQHTRAQRNITHIHKRTHVHTDTRAHTYAHAEAHTRTNELAWMPLLPSPCAGCRGGKRSERKLTCGVSRSGWTSHYMEY